MSLLKVARLPAHRWVAYALADLGHARLELARQYLAAWDGLRGAGVPPKFVRELLEEDLPDQEPMTHVRAWHGSTAPLVLVGDVGTAKSYALAWWALQRHREGLLTHWEPVSSWNAKSFSQLREVNAKLVAKPAVVLDDIGAGGLSPAAANNLEAVILAMHEAERPVACAMNATEEQLRATLGKRVIDRITGEGGKIAVIRSTCSLRRTREPDLSKGRTKMWMRAKWMLEVMGCSMVSRGVYETENTVDCEGVVTGTHRVLTPGQFVAAPTYGDTLAGRPPRKGREDAERVRVRLKLSTKDVVAKAFELEEGSTTDPLQKAVDEFTAGLRAKLDAHAEQKRQTKEEGEAEIRTLVATRRHKTNTLLARKNKPQLPSLDHWLTPQSGGDVSSPK